MRLGISTKLTELYPSKVVLPSVPSANILEFDITQDTYGLKNDDDGQYFGFKFPYSLDGLEESTGNVLGADPFAEYRTGTTATEVATDLWRYPPIDATLDVTITIPAGTQVGANTMLFNTWNAPAVWFYISESSGVYQAAFTEDASKNLIVTLNNSGNISGGGGYGGKGASIYSLKFSDYAGGGGGGGAGIHQATGVSAGNLRPGAPGLEGASGQTSAAENGTLGGIEAGGDGGAGGEYTTGLLTAEATLGANGGSAIVLWNNEFYDSNNPSVGPTITIINKDGGYIYGGGGGGGGGGVSVAVAGFAGGDGGGTNSPVTSPSNATLKGEDGADGATSLGSSGRDGGRVLDTRWLTAYTAASVNGGTLTLTNEHTTGNSVVTAQGHNRAW